MLSVGYLIAVVVLLILALFVPRDAQFEPIILVSDPIDHIIDIFHNIIRIVATLTTAFMGVTIGLGVKSDAAILKGNMQEAIVMLCIMLASAAAYFGIYLLYIRIITMMSNPTLSAIDVNEAQILWAIRLQFWGVVFQATALGYLISRMLDRKIANQ